MHDMVYTYFGMSVGADGLEPVYVVQPGGEYRIGVGLFQIPGARKLQLQGASWLRIALPQGNSVTLPLDQDEGLLPCNMTTVMDA